MSRVALLVLLGGLALWACGPTRLSALGNPGDLCTERSSCPERSECRITESGYRCSGDKGQIAEATEGITPARTGEDFHGAVDRVGERARGLGGGAVRRGRRASEAISPAIPPPLAPLPGTT